MSKSLKNKTGFILSLIKSAVLGVIVSVVLVLILAFVLKIVELSDGVITLIDEVIKIISIFVSTISFIKKSPNKILFKSALLGVVYVFLTFILFSALRGSYVFGISLVIDMLFGGLIGAIIAIILNIFNKDKAMA